MRDDNSTNSLPALPSVVAVQPMLMLTGFLGAGKTTLLLSLLSELKTRGHLADVILNDRENALLDQEILRDSAATLEALSSSCICCDGVDELCRMALQASRSQNNILLIELNGTADPILLQETFLLLESKLRLHPRWQVCVIDGRNFGKRGRFAELERRQLETASHYYIARDSDLSSTELLQLERKIKDINSRATRTDAAALAAALDGAIRSNPGHGFTSQKAKPSGPAGLDFSLTPPPTPKHEEHHHIEHEFTGCSIRIPAAVEPERALQWLEQLPASVIRAKALIGNPANSKKRFLYQRAGQEVSPDPIPTPAIAKVPCSALFIGPDLKPDELLELTRAELHPDCHFPES